MKYNRMLKKVEEEGGDVRDLPAAPRSENDDYVECKYCYRRFAPVAAERHIPKCKVAINRPLPPPHMRKIIE